jgi:hypothetical protein
MQLVALPPQAANEPEAGGGAHDADYSETINPIESKELDIPDLGYSLFGRSLSSLKQTPRI